MSANIVKRCRKLEPDRDVFEHNAWDDTEWTEEMRQEAERRLQEQRNASSFYNLADKRPLEQLEQSVGSKWNNFYRTHKDRFFKDRRWIFAEFPELLVGQDTKASSCSILEVGCGVGNAVAHILDSNKDERLHIYCCDLSQNAIDTLKRRDFYEPNRLRVTPFQADICKDFERIVAARIRPQSLDHIMLIFTLSALKPELMRHTIAKLASLLKPGGMLLFRDYARYDLTQLRFKGSALLRDNYYVRSDGTTSYFFTPDEVDELFGQEGATKCLKVELKQDNRLLVNRLKGVKMCRCWIQAKYKKTCA